LPFERAVVNASAAPARLLGIERDCGTIAVGKRADLSIWDDRYEVLATIVGGEAVYGAHHLASTSPAGV
jgi:N-acetylglucosamine-6-phosphate deacetylase